MKSRLAPVILIPLLLFSLLMVHITNKDAKNQAIEELNARQMMLAERAKAEIEFYFNSIIHFLEQLSTSDQIINFNDVGRKQMDVAISIRPEGIKAITRVDASGKILHTVPMNLAVIDMDISHQTHVRKILTTHQPVASDVFTAVQGYRAVAVHVPVFKEEEFVGTLAVLIDFLSISKRSLETIRIGETGYAWMTSREGIELYCPVPGHIEKSVFETCKNFPTILSMAEKMVQGLQGVTTYEFDRIKEHKTETMLKHAVYLPINIVDSFWTIVVASSEDEVLSALVGFRNKLVIIMGALLLCSCILLFYSMRAWGAIRMEAQRKKAEQALQESEEKYRGLVKYAPVGIYEFDMDKLKFISVNDVMCEYTGYSKAEFLNLNLFDLLSEESMTTFNELVEDVFSNKPSELSTEYKVKGKNQREFWVLANAKFFYDEGVPKRAMAVVHDLTRMRQAEEQRRQLENQLQQSHKMEAIGTLAGGIAHDFNNILSGIFGYSQLAKKHVENVEKTGPYIDQILRGAQRAKDLVQQILTFSRQTQYQKKPFQIYLEVNEALKLLRSTIPSTIEIKKELNSDAKVLADPIRIHQLMMNLCTNAYQAMRKKGGCLTISLDDAAVPMGTVVNDTAIPLGRYVSLKIADTGHGMDKKTLDKAFDPYFTTRKAGEGTGLGLALVQAIVDEHDGFLQVVSRKDKGTTITVYLPVIEESEDVSTGLRQEAVPVQGSEVIIVVDDEAAIRNSYQAILEDAGYTVSIYDNGQAVLDDFTTNPEKFDLILTDMTMPGMTGLELMEAVRAVRIDLPVILCTGFSDLMNEEKAARLGIDRYLMKPLLEEDLTTAVRDVLDARKQHRKK